MFELKLTSVSSMVVVARLTVTLAVLLTAIVQGTVLLHAVFRVLTAARDAAHIYAAYSLALVCMFVNSY